MACTSATAIKFSRRSIFDKIEPQMIPLERLDWTTMIEGGMSVAKDWFEKHGYDYIIYPEHHHLYKLYFDGVLQSSSFRMEMMGDFIQDDEKNLVHVLNLYATHSNKKKKDKLRIIQGLLGMFDLISSLKSRSALNKSIKKNNPARFA